MPCNKPLKAVQLPDGRVQVVRRNEWVNKPLDLACGQCLGCRIDTRKAWAVRCVHEARMHKRNSYITLTYADEHLPAYGSLRKRDWQLFAKRLRKNIGPFRFFHCGEYGDNTLRPHYHALLFGIDFWDDQIHVKTSKGYRLFVSPTLDRTWGKGHVWIGEMTWRTAEYCAGYVMKKLTRKQAKDSEDYERIDTTTGEVHRVEPDYITMSRNPGLGADFLKTFNSDIYSDDQVILDGRRYRPPKYYDKQQPEETRQRLTAERFSKLKKEELKPHRLRTKEHLLELKQRTITREQHTGKI